MDRDNFEYASEYDIESNTGDTGNTQYTNTDEEGLLPSLNSLLSSASTLFRNPSALVSGIRSLPSSPPNNSSSSDSSPRASSAEGSPRDDANSFNIQDNNESAPLLPQDQTVNINGYLSNPAILSLLFHGSYEASERLLKNRLCTNNSEELTESDKHLLEGTFSFGLLLREVYRLAGRVVDADAIDRKLRSFFNRYGATYTYDGEYLSNFETQIPAIYLYGNIKKSNNQIYAFIRHPNQTYEILNLTKLAEHDNTLKNELNSSPLKFGKPPEKESVLIKKIRLYSDYTPLVILAENNEALLKKFSDCHALNHSQNQEKYWNEVWFNCMVFAVFFRNDLFVTLNLFRLLAIRINRVMVNWVNTLDVKNTNIKFIKHFFESNSFSIFSIAFYAPRLILNLVALLYNTFYTPGMSKEQMELGVWERFKIEFELRGGQILNDAVWLSINLLVFCVAKNWIYFIPPEYAMLITVTLYIFDLFNALYAYYKFKENADKALNELCLTLAGGDTEKAIVHKNAIEAFVEKPENRKKYFDAEKDFSFGEMLGELGINSDSTDHALKAAAFSALGVAMRNREELKAKFLTVIVAAVLLVFMIPAALLSFHFSSAVMQALRFTNAVSSAFPPLVNLGVILLKAFPVKTAALTCFSFAEVPKKLEKPKRNGCSGLFKNGQSIPMGDWGGTEESNFSCFPRWNQAAAGG